MVPQLGIALAGVVNVSGGERIVSDRRLSRLSSIWRAHDTARGVNEAGRGTEYPAVTFFVICLCSCKIELGRRRDRKGLYR